MRARHIAAVVAVLLAAAGQALAQAEEFPAEDFPLDEIHIRLERTACDGGCPAYTLDIDGNGHVTYEGLERVATLGRRAWQVPPEDVVDLVQDFIDARFFAAAPEYRGAPGDTVAAGARIPGARLTLDLGVRSHTVYLYRDFPAELALLPMRVDDAARVAARGRAPAAKGSAAGPIFTQ